jgi:hypothetical protein
MAARTSTSAPHHRPTLLIPALVNLFGRNQGELHQISRLPGRKFDAVGVWDLPLPC